MIAVLLAQTIAVTGGTVYPVSGPKIANATVLIRDGKIAVVGTSVVVPSDATRIDAAGKWVTPGLIDGGGQMGLVESGAAAGTRDGSPAPGGVAAGAARAAPADRECRAPQRHRDRAAPGEGIPAEADSGRCSRSVGDRRRDRGGGRAGPGAAARQHPVVRLAGRPLRKRRAASTSGRQ